MEERLRLLHEAALTSTDYRNFLGKTFDVLGSTSRAGKFNFSAFARKAGLQSRGFAQEVVTGRKRLTPQSYPKFVKALGLPFQLRKYFALLVMRDEAEFNDQNLSREEIEAKLAAVKERIRGQVAFESESSDGQGPHQEIFKATQFLSVYAVLGCRNGSDIDDVVRKTGLHPAVCRGVLHHLVQSKLVTEKAGRYKSVHSHLVAQHLPGDHEFKTAYLETVEHLKRRATADFDSPESLYIHSYFSIDRKRLPEFKKRLWSLVLEYIDSCDDDEGDAVYRLLVGLLP